MQDPTFPRGLGWFGCEYRCKTFCGTVITTVRLAVGASAAAGVVCRRMLPALLLALAPAMAAAFDWPDVEHRAQALAAAAYVKPEAKLPAELRQLNYEQYQNIRFKHERAYWHDAGSPVELAFFHRGMAFDLPVKISEVAGGETREIKYTPEAFDFGPNRIEAGKLQGLGYAGFRVHYAMNNPKVKDEVLVFLGASIVGRWRDHFSWRFVIDFACGTQAMLGPAVRVEPVIAVSRGTVEIPSLRPLAELPGYRAIFDLRPEDESGESVNLRLFLRLDGEALSETWLYQWTPPSLGERAAFM